jgi:hypothetical protein
MISRYASLRQGLVGAWCPSVQRCGSGFTLPDLSGYGNNGSLVNMDPGTDCVASGGKLALDFDGVNDYVATSSSVNSLPFTISFWAINNTTGVLFSILSQAVNQWDGWYGGIGFLTAVNFNSFGSIVTNSLSNSAVWQHHCYVVLDNVNAVYYVNGIPTTGTLNRTPSRGFYRFAIGCSYRAVDRDNFANGQIDDIRQYTRALTPSEIQQLYTGGRGVGLIPERIKHRRKTTAAAFNRRRRILIGASS